MRDATRAALRIYTDVNDPRGVAQCLEALAQIASEQAHYETAARLIGSAAALRARLAAPPPAAEQARTSAVEQALARSLGPEATERFLQAGRAMPAQQAAELAMAVASGTAPGDRQRSWPVPLTRRERQVAALVASGRTNRQIGRVLGISEKTTEVHLQHVMAKLAARSRAEVAAWAATQQLSASAGTKVFPNGTPGPGGGTRQEHEAWWCPKEGSMTEITDPTFYRTPADAIAAAPESLAYVAAFDPRGEARDAMAVLDCDDSSTTYGEVVGWAELPTGGNELHHFGWNACSSALCHGGHAGHLERRYLIVPGLRSSRIYILDTKPDPRAPRVIREIEAGELAAKAGYSRPHTLHCGPDGIFMSALGGANGNDGPGGVALLDHETFDVVGAWEADRGEQYFGYDVWWHLNHDTVITSEWATPSMFESGLNPEDLLGRKFGHHLNFWSLSRRELTQRIDLGDAHQMVLELRPAHNPSQAYGFVGVVISVEDLSGSVWLWHKDGDRWAARKVITIPAEPADPGQLPPALRPFSAVPPLISDIDLSVDDRWLYVACWGTGELKQYDVSDPFAPRETASVRLGGIVGRRPHPAAPELPLSGGPQMVEISRDGRRVYLTNSLYAAWDDIFYPDGVGAWLAKLDADPVGGGLSADRRFFPHGDAFRGLRVHQTRLQGGDASSDSYCFTG